MNNIGLKQPFSYESGLRTDSLKSLQNVDMSYMAPMNQAALPFIQPQDYPYPDGNFKYPAYPFNHMNPVFGGN